MRPGDLPVRSSMLAEIVDELDRRGASRPANIARRLGRNWTEDRVRAALAELYVGGVVGQNSEVGFWWVA